MAAAKASTILVLASVTLAVAAADGFFGKTPGCHAMLDNIAAQGHSDLELAAYCHASLPPQFCRDAVASLGEQPWSVDSIASTCKSFEDRYASRRPVDATGRTAEEQGMTFPDIQKTVEECMATKAEAGLCKDQGRPMTVDECIAWKQEKYPEMTAKIQDAVARFYDIAMGQASTMGMSEQVTPVHTASQRFSIGFLVGLASIAAASVAAVAMALNRLGRVTSPRSLLVFADGEEDELSDA